MTNLKEPVQKWTQNEIKVLMNYAESSDDETKQDMYNYVHHMMYNEGNHPDFPKRTLSAITAKIRQTINLRNKPKP